MVRLFERVDDNQSCTSVMQLSEARSVKADVAVIEPMPLGRSSELCITSGVMSIGGKTRRTPEQLFLFGKLVERDFASKIRPNTNKEIDFEQ